MNHDVNETCSGCGTDSNVGLVGKRVVDSLPRIGKIGIGSKVGSSLQVDPNYDIRRDGNVKSEDRSEFEILSKELEVAIMNLERSVVSIGEALVPVLGPNNSDSYASNQKEELEPCYSILVLTEAMKRVRVCTELINNLRGRLVI